MSRGFEKDVPCHPGLIETQYYLTLTKKKRNKLPLPGDRLPFAVVAPDQDLVVEAVDNDGT